MLSKNDHHSTLEEIKMSNDHASVHDANVNALTYIKYVVSCSLLLFSIFIIMALIFREDTSLAQDAHPAVAFIVIWVAIIWLSQVEGGQASLVGLPPVDRDLYEESHPIAHRCTSWAHKGDNLDRYLMGRQFMVLLIVFVINLSGAPTGDAELWEGWPDIIKDIFLVSGLGMILLTANVGQLNTQVNASHCMLDYLNSYFALFTLAVAMAIEFSGIMHASYLIQMAVAAMAGKPIVSNEPPRSAGQALFFYARCLMSVCILVGAFVVTFAALFEGKTTMWSGVPEAVSLILFFVLMAVVGMLEGMQIAFFAVAKLPENERGDSFFAKKTCELLFRGNGQNLPGFMVGRQLCVVSCFFIIARVTTLDVEVGEGNNILGVNDGLQEFLNTGLHAAVITTIVASISWQLVASAFPIAFLSNPVTYVLLNICLALEATGICSAAWVIAKVHKSIAGFQYDEVYIGTPEERVAKKKADHERDIHDEPGHLTGSAFPAGVKAVGSGDGEEDLEA